MADTCVCPSCQRELRVPKELWGTPVRCPKCDKTFVAQVDNSLGWEEPPIPEGKELAEEKPPRRRRPRRDEEDEEDEDWPRRRRELRGHSLGIVVICLLAFGILMDLGALAVDLVQLHQDKPAGGGPVRPQPNNGPAANDDLAELAEAFSNPFSCAQPFVYLSTAVIYCFWIYRIYDNLHLLRVKGLQHSAGWAVGSYFVPFINLVRPAQIAQEMWRASDPETPIDDLRAWRHRSGSLLIGFWWAFWIINNVVAQISFRMALGGKMPEETTLTVDSLNNVVSVLTALLLIAIIHRLQYRQRLKFERLQEYQESN